MKIVTIEKELIDGYENILDPQTGNFRYDGSTVWVEPTKYYCGFLDYVDKDNPKEEEK